MRLQLPELAETVEDAAFADLAFLLGKATGEDVTARGGGRNGVRVVVGRRAASEALRRLIDQGIATDAAELGPDEIFIGAFTSDAHPVVVATGGSPEAAAWAVYYLLEHVLDFGFFPTGDRIPDLRGWQPGRVRIQRRPALAERLFMLHPFYAAPWRYCCRLWDESEWRKLITWLRRKRFTGIVCWHDDGAHMWGRAFFDAFPEVKRSRNPRGFVIDPDQRTEINRHMFRYARESGLKIVYRLMYSVLPDLFADAHADLTLHPQPTDSVAVCAAMPECIETMRQFWRRILEIHPPEKNQAYLISPYYHRAQTCEHVRDRSVPSLDAINVIADLDPDGIIYLDAPCGPDSDANRAEWEHLAGMVPPNVGVVDWDCSLRQNGGWPVLDPHPTHWMPTAHITRTGCYPPASVAISGEQMQQLWKAAKVAGADGVIAFNVLANTSVNLCDYAAELGWNPDLTPHEHLADYARRRYDRGPAEQMTRAYIRMDDCLVPDLTLPGAPTSLERQLTTRQQEGTITKDWLQERVTKVSEWLEIACSARSLAVAAVPDGDAAEVPQRFLRETVYIEWRCLGILALLRAHRARSQAEAADLVVEAVDRLRALAERYEYPDLAMAHVRDRAKERGLHYTQWFLDDWRAVGAGSEEITRKSRLIPVCENFGVYEQAIIDAAPVQVRDAAVGLLQSRDSTLAERKKA